MHKLDTSPGAMTLPTGLQLYVNRACNACKSGSEDSEAGNTCQSFVRLIRSSNEVLKY